MATNLIKLNSHLSNGVTVYDYIETKQFDCVYTKNGHKYKEVGGNLEISKSKVKLCTEQIVNHSMAITNTFVHNTPEVVACYNRLLRGLPMQVQPVEEVQTVSEPQINVPETVEPITVTDTNDVIETPVEAEISPVTESVEEPVVEDVITEKKSTKKSKK